MVRKITTAQLHRIAVAFRAGLEQAPWPDYMNDFPHGCCGMAADLLGLYLIETKIGTALYVLGEDQARQKAGRTTGYMSHAWLVLNGLIIDITADQFDDVDDAVIVQRTSAWHLGWTIKESHCHPVGDQRPIIEFIRTYEVARKIADEHLRAKFS